MRSVNWQGAGKSGERLTVAAIASPERDVDPHQLQALAEKLSGDWEILIVARGLSSERARKLIAAIQEVPDTTAHFLDASCSDNLARLAALDMAIGDLILLVEDAEPDVANCLKMVEHAKQGLDVVVEQGPNTDRSALYRSARGTFLRAYNAISGLHIEYGRFGNRLYTRAAARYLLSQREAEMLLSTSRLADAFPGISIPLSGPSRALKRESGLRKAYRALNFTRSVPLRFVVVICVVSAILNVGYMGFALISKLIDQNVEPGWSSLSLQIGGIFLLLSIVLGIIAEHLIEVDRAVNRRPRYHLLREVRSPLSNARRSLNIVEVMQRNEG